MAPSGTPSLSKAPPAATEEPAFSFGTVLPLGLQLLFWTVYGFAFYSTLLRYLPFPDIAQYLALWAAGTGFLVSTLLAVGLHPLLNTALPPVGKALGLLVAVGGGGAGWSALYYVGADVLNPFAGPVLSLTAVLPGQGALLSWPIAFPLLLLLWSGLALGVQHLYQQHKQQRQLLKTEVAAERARLRMLRYQLSPHFFFNALNTIGALAEESPSRVQTAIRKLSGFLRYTLLDGEEDDPASAIQTVPLQAEIEAARCYLAVEKLRFEDELQWTVDLDDEAPTQAIPAFLLLPLVENAVKHGQRTSPPPLKIIIQGKVTTAPSSGPSSLLVEVVNTGHLRSEGERGTETGLDNVQARLDARYPEQHRFTLTEERDKVRARIEIDADALDDPPPSNA